MKIFTRFLDKPFTLLTLSLLLLFTNQHLLSQTAVTSVTAGYVNLDDSSNDYMISGNGGAYPTGTTFNVQHTSTSTANNNLVLTDYSISGSTYIPFLLAEQININRVDNAAVSGNRGIIFHERESFSDPILKLSSEYVPQMEDALNSIIINRGADNVFANQGGTHINNIERIDYVWTAGGLQTTNPAASGFIVIERGGNDPFKVAPILSIDGSGQPTSFGTLLTVANTNWGDIGFSIATTVFVKDDADPNFKPSGDVGSQNINALYLSFSDLGIGANTVMYGYSIFANDVNIASHVLLDVNTFPTDTSGASGEGGIDLVGAGGAFSEDGNLTTGPLPCSITAISTSNLSVCNDNGTGANSADDFFTADVTVTFANAPATGTLDLTGDGTASVSVSGLASPHTFTTVQMTADGGAIDLTATFSADGACTFNETNAGTAPTSCSVPSADVSVTKTLNDTSPYQTGDTITYAVVVTNNGPDAANNVMVSDTPSNITITGVAGGGGGCTGFPGCNLGTIASGANVTLTVTATIDAVGAFSNTVSVTADETDPVLANNIDDGTDGNNGGTAAGVADVSVTKTLNDTSPYQTGDTITYAVVVTNNGPDAANNVMVSDTPSNITITGVAGGGGGCTGFPGCNLGTIASGANVTLTVTATIDAVGAFSNTVSVTADETDPVLANNIDDGTDGNNGGTAAAVADVSVTKTLNDTSPYQTGDTITYAVVVTNNGPDAANNVMVSDTPSNITITGVSGGGGGCTGFPGCNLGTIASGANVTLTVTATIDAVGAFSNTTSVTADETDPVLANNIDDGTDGNNGGTAAAVADVSVTKTLNDTSPYQTGDTITYAVVVTNNGPDAANNVMVSDTPSNITITGVSGGGGGCTGFPGCNLGTIASGANVTLTVTATIDAVGAFSNTTSVSADETDPVLANNIDDGTDGNNGGTAAAVADVSVTKTLNDTSPYQTGDTITYAVVVTNNGPDAANNVMVSDTPSNITITGVSGGGGGCTGFPGCNLGTIASGANVTLTVTATIDAVGAFSNTTSVTADETDPVLANNIDDGTDGNNGGTAAAVADVSVTKTLNDTSPYQTGDTITYAVVVTNNGPDAANNVMVSDTPSNITITGVSGGGGGCTGFPGCNLGTIASGANVTLTVTATIDAVGAFSNTTSVSADETDPVLANNIDDGTDGNNGGTAAAVADVSVTKTLNDTSPYQTGDTITYAVVVTNNGPDAANNVMVSDTPSNITITGVSGGGGGCTGFPGCNLGTIASGANVTLTVTATIDAVGAFSNTTSVSADETDPVLANNIDDGTDGNNGGTATAVADVSVTKTLNDTSPYQTGDTITYAVVVTNNGPDAANNVMVTDTPSNITITGVSGGGGGCTGFPGCNLGTIASGANVTLTVTATIDAVGAFSNTTSVSADETDPVLANNIDDGTDGNNGGTAAAVADVSVTKTLNDTSPYQTGDTITYAVVVTNNGPDAANNVMVSDTPSNITITGVSGGGGGGCTGFPGCNLGTIASGANVTLTVTATIDAVGAFSNTASVSADETDPVLANNIDDGTDGNNGGTAAAVADVSVTKTLNDTSPYQTGDTITYAVVVTNNGPDAANNVMVSDTPSNITITGVSGGGGGCTGFPGCNLGTIASGANVTLTVTATIDAVGAFSNTTSVSADETDPVLANNIDDGTDGNNGGTAAAVADVSVTKTLNDTSPYQTGDTITYAVVVTNNGPDAANNVMVTDTPSNITITGVSGGGGGCTGFPGCNLGTIASGANVTLTVTATIDAVGAFSNTTSVTADETDPVLANNIDDGTDGNNGGTAAAVADVSVTKTLNDTSPYQTGDTITYDIVVTNNGPDAANNVMVSDTPSNITITGVSGGGGGCTGFPGCNLGTIASGANVTLTVTATIDAVGAFSNTTSVSADETDPVLANNIDDGTDGNNGGTAAAVADVSVTKTLNDTSPYQTGDTITYDIVVTNNGLDAANNVMVSDTPSNITITGVSGGGGGCTGFPGCNLGTIASGANVTLTVTATIDAVGAFSNTVSVSADETDPVLANNIDDGTDGNNGGTAAGVADLVTVKTLASGTATPPEADVVTFTITVTNNGPDTATGITLDDTIPTGLTATGNNGNTGGAQASTYLAPTWSIPLLNSGESVTLTIEGTIDIGQDGNTITNNTTAAVGAENDPTTAGDDLTESVLVTGCLDTDGDGDCDFTDPDPADPCNFTAGSVPDTTNPIWQAADCDGDGETNGEETTNGTDPTDPCANQMTVVPANPMAPGTPAQTAYDIWAAADCDGDGVSNGVEGETDGTNPYDLCDYDPTSQVIANVTAQWNDADCDGDGVTNGQEVIDGTDPLDECSYDPTSQVIANVTTQWNDADCDGDGVTNGQEVIDGTDPLDECSYDPTSQVIANVTAQWNDADCDGDGVTNGQEVIDGTDPLDECSYDPTSQVIANVTAQWNDADCDGDGVTNGQEVIDGTDPLDECSYDPTSQVIANVTAQWNDADCDGDGVTNGQEVIDGTDPLDECSYDPTSQVIANVTAQWNDADCDGDGVTNGQEVIDGTDPLDECSYDPTSQVIANVTAQWNDADCDGDGVTNGDEIADGTDPQDPCDYVAASQTTTTSTTWNDLDCDGDGVTNGDEIADGTDPQDPCDYIAGSQTTTTSTTWNDLDCDGDGVTNGDEIADGTDPQDPCDYVAASQTTTTSTTWNDLDCDGDGVTNGDEIADGTDPQDPCDYIAASQTTTTSTTWNDLDCDGDGVTNGDEIADGTDPQDPCDYVAASQTTTTSTTWNDLDCDGDGVTNGDEIADGTDPQDPCDYVAASQTTTTTTTWNDLDCDGDGVTNGDEIADGTDPQDPCDYLAASQTTTTSTTWNDLDCDGDGVTNGDEIADGTDPQDPCDYVAGSQTTTTTTTWNDLDCDGDGVTNGDEIADGTDPQDPCDYLAASQTTTTSTTWNDLDCDGDGVTNGDEIADGTDPQDPCDYVAASQTTTTSTTWNDLDCDGDGVTNGDEIADGTDPQDPCDYVAGSQTTTTTTTWNDLDCDGDGVTNGDEIADGTDPQDPCDYVAASQTTTTSTTWNDLDCDGDGVTNGDEIADGTDPQDPCDYLAGSQTTTTSTTWNDLDCDGDGVTNGDEIADGTDPQDPCDYVAASQTTTTSTTWNDLDCDGDGVTNGDEIADGTDPQDPCDYIAGSQTTTTSTTWNDLDCDGDGVTNGDEIADGTDPQDPCDYVAASQTTTTSTTWNDLDCDGDGVTNGDEIADGTDPQDPCDYVPASQTTTTSTTWNDLDCDGDGVTNGDEIADGTDPQDPCDYLAASQTTTTTTTWNDLDCDGDGVTNGDEIADGTDPQDPCDYVAASQTTTTSTTWNDLDCDGDGVTNGDEIADGTDPQDPCDYVAGSQTTTTTTTWNDLDCDGDGVTNGDEIADGTDPLDPCDFITSSQTVTPSNEWNDLDCDGDGVTNGDEIADGTDPQDLCDFITSSQTVTPSNEWNTLDCDGDGVVNAVEIDNGTDPQDPCDFITLSQTVTPSNEWNDLDCDGDGVTNGDEIADGTDPQDPCDYVAGSQTVATTTTWNDLDCDGDGVTNGDEIADGTDPQDPCDFVTQSQTTTTSSDWNDLDCDGDGVTNGDEIADGTDPLDPCDYVAGSQTILTSTTWNNLDCDGDGVTNGDELIDGTDPLDPCDFITSSQTLPVISDWYDLDCDGDGVSNGDEIADGTDPFDPCSFVLTSQSLPTSSEWNDLDCDGDGVTNGDEIADGTNPLDLCDFDLTSQTLSASSQWNDIDCDGDGVTNADEVLDGTDPLDVCDFDYTSQTINPSLAWELADCDCDGQGDGIPNGDETGDNNVNGIPDYLECNNVNVGADDGLQIYDIMTPNGDGLNDVFVIRGIEKYADNTVKIYNRWGVVVFETRGYGVADNYFRGISNGRVTIAETEQLPVGTYYYVLTYVNDDGDEKQLAGPLYINRK